MKKELYSYSQEYVNRWVVSYADFVTMLLALFMVMYALSQINVNNLKKFSESVSNKFDGVKSASAVNHDFQYKEELEKVFSTTKVDINLSNSDLLRNQEQARLLKEKINKAAAQIDKETVEFSNTQRVISQKLGDANGVSLEMEPRGLVIRLKDMIIFEPGSDIIRGEAKSVLDKLAEVLRGIPNSIRIEGHTDNQPIRTAKFPSNWELSTARSTNLVRYLINKHGFNPGKLSAVGYGEFMPVESNFSQEGRNINRRVDIVILNSTSKLFDPNSKLSQQN